MSEQIIKNVAGKLLAENCNFLKITPEEAKEKLKNCVGFHLLEKVIDQDFNKVIDQMKKDNNYINKNAFVTHRPDRKYKVIAIENNFALLQDLESKFCPFYKYIYTLTFLDK